MDGKRPGGGMDRDEGEGGGMPGGGGNHGGGMGKGQEAIAPVVATDPTPETT